MYSTKTSHNNLNGMLANETVAVLKYSKSLVCKYDGFERDVSFV